MTAGLTQLLAGLVASTALFVVPAAVAPTQAAAATPAGVPAVVGPQVARGGACNAFTGAYQLPGSNGVTPAAYSDSSIVVPACGPRGSTNPVWVNPYPGSLTTAGYQCVEFSRRYLYYKYGAVYNKSTNGDQIVDHYFAAYPTFFTVVPNGTVGKAPVPGDVLSFSPVPTFNSSTGGHTTVVQRSAVNASGNGYLTLVEENASASGVVVIPVTAWRVAYGSFTYAKWLHAKSNARVPTQPPPPPPPPSPTANGNFVSYQSHVYRIAGGAPIYVSSWLGFGGSRAVQALTDSQWATLTSVPADGTLVTATGSGQVYRIAGGAPVYVSAWSNIGGAAPSVLVDQAALDGAGKGAQFDHLRDQPADGTLVSAGPKGQVSRFAGGAPLYLPPASVPAGSALTTVDPAALANAGAAGRWSHVSYRPAAGTFLRGGPAYYRVAGGAVLAITDCASVSATGCVGAALVDPADLTNAGRAAPWDHLLATVPNGTLVSVADGASSGRFSRAVGGALLTVPSCTPELLKGCAGAVVVNQGSLDSYAITHPAVANGTYLRVADGTNSGQVAVAAGGALLDLAQCTLTALRGCPGQVPVDAASMAAYSLEHPIPRPGTAVRALDSGVSWSFATNCRQVAAPSSAAVAVVTAAIGQYPDCIAIVLPSVPNALAGIGYVKTLTATGGTGHYIWSVTSGRLPPGFVLSGNGVLHGVTRNGGAWSFVVTASDAAHPTVTSQRTYRVTVAPMTIRNAPTLAAGKRGQVYRQQLVFSAGTGTHVFRLVAGHLPPGLALAATGVIYGRPTKAGTSHAGIQMTDASRPALSTMKVFAITIN
ncbi:MAG: hypothetical protein ABI468_02015 [Candidatus Nanopelagicales bacterium]